MLFLQSSPPSFCAEGRTPDLQAILSVISDAQQFVYIAVMDYMPIMVFSSPKRSVFSFPASVLPQTELPLESSKLEPNLELIFGHYFKQCNNKTVKIFLVKVLLSGQTMLNK